MTQFTYHRVSRPVSDLARLVCIALALAALIGQRPLSADDTHSIAIGVSTPLTGEVATAGEDVRDALLFANSKFFGGKYRFILEDDRCDNKTGLGIAHKFIAVDKVKYVLGMICNAVLLSSAPVYRRAGTVIIATGATSGDVPHIGESIFRPYPADHLAAEVLYDYISPRHKVLGVVTQQEEYTALMERAILRRNAEATAPLQVIAEQLPLTVRDFVPTLLRFKAKGADALFFNAIGEPGYIEMVKQARAIGLRIPHYGACLPASPTTRRELGALDEGARFANIPLFESLLTPEGQQIYAEYVAHFGEPRSAPIFAALTIDALRMLDRALMSGKPAAEYLHTTSFSGMVGEIAFDQDGAVKGLHYVMQEIRAGKVAALPQGE
jgi:ABC-type branched-subunit amino acid transport system substrate-binding protein